MTKGEDYVFKPDSFTGADPEKPASLHRDVLPQLRPDLFYDKHRDAVQALQVPGGGPGRRMAAGKNPSPGGGGRIMYCEAYKATIPERTCLLRFAEMKDWSPESSSPIGKKAYPQKGRCIGCEVGRRLFENHEKGEDSIDMDILDKDKRCEGCREMLPRSAFKYDGRTKDKKKRICIACDKGVDPEAGKKKAAVPAPTDVEKPEGDGTGFVLMLDFSEYELLYEDIVVEAKENLRTPEMQAMWLISQALYVRKGEKAHEQH